MKALSFATKSSLALTTLALTVSFCVALLCYLFVGGELSYDRLIPRAGDTFRVDLTITPPGSEPIALPNLTAQAGSLIQDIGGVGEVTRLSMEDLPVTLNGRPRRLQAYVVDPNFLSFFGLNLVLGDPSQALRAPGSVVLNEETALELFGSTDVIGREIEYSGSALRVTAILGDVGNMHFDPRVLLSSSTAATRLNDADRGASPGEFFAHTYLRLSSADDFGRVAAALAAIPGARPIMPEQQQTALRPSLSLMPVTDIHLNGLPAGELKPGGNMELIWAIVGVAVIVVGTACLNLAILVGADADSRTREIGVRRAFGASRFQILGGFAARYALIAGACMIAALASMILIIPTVSRYLARDLRLTIPDDIAMIVVLPSLAVLASVVALALTSTNSVNAAPAVALRGDLIQKGLFWRAVAASAQFGLSIVLISTTLIIGAQVSLAVDESLSIGNDEILIMDGLRPPFPPSSHPTLAQLVQTVPGVISVGLSEIVPTDMSTTMVGLMNPVSGMQEPIGFEANPVNAGFFQTYGIAPLAGALFRDEQPSNEIVLSLSAASALGFRPAQETIGQTVSMASSEGLEPFTIVALVADVPMKSIEGRAERLVFTNVGERARYLSVRVTRESSDRVREEIEKIWAEFSPDVPKIASLRDRLEDLYRPLSQTFLFFGGLAVTALAIAALGISATANYTAERRYKEMGLRRAMGASKLEVARELLSSILLPLIIASAVAIPIAVVAGSGWLAGFAQRIPLTVTPFGIATISVLLIALAASILQVFPVIGRGPAEALRRDQ